MTQPLPDDVTIEPKQRQLSPFAIKIPQYGDYELTIAVNPAMYRGTVVPDNMYVTITQYTLDDSNDVTTTVIVDNQKADDDDLTHYHYWLDAQYTEQMCSFDVKWSWQTAITGQGVVDRSYTVQYEIVEPMPQYQSLNDNEKAICNSVMFRFSDLFDNTRGGDPNFYEQYQTIFGLNAIAKLMVLACNYVNMAGQPYTSFTVTGDFASGSSYAGELSGEFPTPWLGVLELATYIEVLRHFIRTYTEQPTIIGSTDIAYADRREYMDRWIKNLQLEQPRLQQEMIAMKMSLADIAGTSALVAGGMYGQGWYTSNYQAAYARGARFMGYVPMTPINI